MRIGAVPVPVSPLDKADNFRHFVEDSYATRRASTDAGDAAAAARGARRPRRCAYVVRGGEGAGVDRARRRRSPRRTTSSRRRRRTATTWRSGSTARARPASRRASCTSSTTSRSRARPTRARCSGCARTTSRSRRRSSSTPTGWATACRSRCWFGATVGAAAPGRRSPTRSCATLRERRPTVFFSVPALYGAARARRGGRRRVRLRAHVRVGRRGAAAADLRALEGALRPGDRRRHRLDRDAPHLLLEPSRARSSRARPAGRCRATSCGSSTRTARVLDGAGGRRPRGARRLVRGVLLAPAREDQGAACAATGSRPATATSAREDGAYVYVGRVDDMLKVGGLWVSPIDMENVLLRAPARARRRRRRRHGRGRSRVAAYIECEGEPATTRSPTSCAPGARTACAATSTRTWSSSSTTCRAR